MRKTGLLEVGHLASRSNLGRVRSGTQTLDYLGLGAWSQRSPAHTQRVSLAPGGAGAPDSTLRSSPSPISSLLHHDPGRALLCCESWHVLFCVGLDNYLKKSILAHCLEIQVILKLKKQK